MKRHFFFLLAFVFVSTLHAEMVAPNGAKRLENYRTSWLGNSFGGLDPETGKPCWVQQDIAAIHVCADGTIYTNVPWEEAGGNCSMYKDGKMLGSAGHTHGWGFNGGKAVAANDKYVFIALKGNNENGGLNDPETWPPKGYDWYGVSRRLRSDFTKGAPFEHGKGGKGDTLPKSFLVVNEVEKWFHAEITGLWADAERLYVSNPYMNRIEIYDVETMEKLSEWNLNDRGHSNPGQIAADKQGNIWLFHAVKKVFRGGDVKFNTIAQYDRDGKPLKGRVLDILEHIQNAEEKFGGSISHTSDDVTLGPFCFGPDNTMYVFNAHFGIDVYPPEPDGSALGDNGTKKDRVKLLGSVDDHQGYDGIPHMYPHGEFGNLRFGGGTVKALGCDAGGNLYIAQDFSSNGGGTILESYRLTGKTLPMTPEWKEEKLPPRLEAELNWRLFGLCFVDCAALDPDDETVAYTKDEKYRLDWSQTEPGKEWSLLARTFPKYYESEEFRESRYRSYENPRRMIKDSAGVWIRNYRGHKFMFMNDMNGQWLRFCEFETPASRNPMLQGDGSDEEYRHGFPNFPRNYDEFILFMTGVQKDEYYPEPYVRLEFASMDWFNDIVTKSWNSDGSENIDIFPNKEEYEKEPASQGWWVDSKLGIWRASETLGIRYAPVEMLGQEESDETFDIQQAYHFMKLIPHPAEFKQVKRIRYDAETDTLYLGGCATVDGVEYKNQHWKPMGPVVCRYDNFLKGPRRSTGQMGELKWKIVLPHVKGSKGHESCEPMGFDIAGDYMFVPYTGSSKEHGVKHGRVEVYRLADGKSVGWMEPDPKTVGEIGLQDIRECLSAHRLKSGEYVVFLEDDYKAKVVMYRVMLP